MAFRFPLEVLFRLRQSAEHQQELLLTQANQEVAQLNREIANIQAEIATRAWLQIGDLTSGLRGAELQFNALCIAALRDHHQEVQRQLINTQRLQASCAEEFRQARQQREAMGTLRNHELDAYRQQQQRSDQRKLDEMFLLRHAYLHRRSLLPR